MTVKDKLVSLQAMNKRYRKYQSFFYAVLILDGVSVIAFTEFTSYSLDYLFILIVMTFIAIVSTCIIFAFAGIRAGLEKSCKLFMELE